MMLSMDITPRQRTNLDSHPSLNASMDDFEAREFSPTLPDLPSQHSGFRSHANSEYSETSSRRSYSPPAWRKAGSGWFSHQQSLEPRHPGDRSKEPSPYRQQGEEDVDDLDVAAYRTASRIPLPESPIKGRTPSHSPEPVVDPMMAGEKGGGEVMRSIKKEEDDEETYEGGVGSPVEQTPTQNNYIRFSTSLDVVQRTEPIEATILTIRKFVHHLTESKYNLFIYALSSLMFVWTCQNLLAKPVSGPAPDLIKVAGIAKSFEPVIYYSEHGHAQIEQLQETGVAVWDLGESLRSSNMTSASLIVHQLDDLSDSLKTLAVELTRFFAGIDSDVDSILLVMEWAQRELTMVSSEPPGTLGSIWSNAHSILTRAGLMGQSKLAEELLGLTYQQRTKAALERTFHEFLSVLEESINNELNWSTQLFQLFEAIDAQYMNLQRTVVREQDTQERLESDFLGSLWTRVIGTNASKLRKYERNRALLRSVRDRTVDNKRVLSDHNARLLALKSNLEILRRKLVSPLVRSENGSTSLSLEAQIQGLEGTYVQLRSSREAQKRKLMDIVYGAGTRRVTLPGEEVRGVEGGYVR